MMRTRSPRRKPYEHVSPLPVTQMCTLSPRYIFFVLPSPLGTASG